MPIAKTIQAPTWVSSGAEISGGRDLLGLRLPVQHIGGTLLNGITTGTRSVRYLAFRAWLIYRYGRSGQPDRWQAFTDFAARIESALVLSNLSQDRSITELVGSEEALKQLDGNMPNVAVSALTQSPASTIYAGASDQLGITKSRDYAVPALVAERGVPLAKALDRTLSAVPIIEKLLSRQDIEQASVDNLRELGAVARIDQVPNEERELLIAAIIPAEPLTREHARIGTYAALLALASQLNARPSEANLFDAACSMARFGEPILDQVADGWTSYCVRDSIAVTQEAVMEAVMNEIIASPDGGQGGVDSEFVISGLMERIEEHDAALRDLGLLGTDESTSDLSFRELQSRIDNHLSVDSILVNGILRWPHMLTEPALYRRAFAASAGALSLAVVAWLLAQRRVGDAVRENGQAHGRLSYQGWRRMGLRDVILPELERFQREDRSLREVAAEMAYSTVQQHLQITWSRLQVDLRRDVALLTAEGNKWYSRGKDFRGGRTASRLDRALGWLGQLDLIDDDGITADGEVVLKQALGVLSEGTKA